MILIYVQMAIVIYHGILKMKDFNLLSHGNCDLSWNFKDERLQFTFTWQL